MGILILIAVGIFIIATIVQIWAKYKAIQIIDKFALDSLALIVTYEKNYNNIDISSWRSPEAKDILLELNSLADELQTARSWYKVKMKPFEEVIQERFPKLCKALEKRGLSYGL